jgi:uncharacterized repeat protein (TIGR01451 family)
VTNSASVIAFTPDEQPVTDVDATTVPCRAAESSIHVDKLANETRLVMGGQISYHIIVTNDGGLPLDQIVVRDSIPDGLSFVNADFDDYMFQLVSTDPVVRLESLQPVQPSSDEAITLFFNASSDYDDYNLATGDSTVVNMVRVRGIDPKKDRVRDIDTALLQMTVPLAAIQLHYAHTTGEIIPGELATYLATVENIGSHVLSNVLLAIPDLAAQGLEYVESNYDEDEVMEDHTGGFHRWRLINPLIPDAAEQIRITYRAVNDISLLPDVVNSVAKVTALDENKDPVADDGEESVPLSPKRGEVLIDNTAAQGEILPGELVTYILTVTAGPELDLVDLVVTGEDLLPQGLTFFETSYDTSVFDQTDDFEWTALDTIHAGAQEEIRVTYRAHADVDSMPGTVTMVAEVTADDIYGRPVSDSDDEHLPVLLPESHLLLEKIALGTALVPGETVTYLITATNNGTQDLANLTITDLLPSQLTTFASHYDSVNVVFDGDPTEPTWILQTELEPGEAITVRLLAERRG